MHDWLIEKLQLLQTKNGAKALDLKWYVYSSLKDLHFQKIFCICFLNLYLFKKQMNRFFGKIVLHI
jgi:hypothetical protein